MIRINKPKQPPAILRHRGKTATRKLCAAYDQSPKDYRSGAKTFQFDSDIYGDSSVKETLRRAQHDKCCFCESKVTHVDYGDVEHFRPKAGYRQKPADALGRPGYYWLAYEWSNLFFSCQICNQQHKKNLFPLRNPTKRARSHHDDVQDEKPLFIDPAAVEPADYIGFREEIAYAINGNRVGATTIESLGLNRPELIERRTHRLNDIKRLKETRELLIWFNNVQPLPDFQARLEKFDADLKACVQDSAEYAAMARAVLAKRQ